MLADRFYPYIHDSEQKKIKNLQPMKKFILKQTARHSFAAVCLSFCGHEYKQEHKDTNKNIADLIFTRKDRYLV